MKNNNDLILGKVPPNATDVEKTIIGSILLNPDVLRDVLLIFQDKNPFYKENYGIIYDTIFKMKRKGKEVDMVTVMNQLRDDNNLEKIGGAFFLAGCTNDIINTSNISAHCLIVMEKYIARELIKSASDVISKAYDESVDVFETLETAQDGLFKIAQQNITTSHKSLGLAAYETLQNIKEAKESEENGVVHEKIVTGFTKFDELLYEFKAGNTYIIAARPSVGKTTFAHNMAFNIAKSGIGVAFFSLEMTCEDLSSRILSNHANVPFELMQSGKTGQTHDYDLQQAQSYFNTLNFIIDDNSGHTIMSMRAKLMELVQKNNIKIVFIDYLQLIEPEKNNRDNVEQQVSKISRGLKRMSKDLNIPIVILSQLSRDIEKRSNPEPVLADLRSSGSIEQDATMVAFLYREDYQVSDENTGVGDNAVVNIKKYRGGKLGKVILKSNLAFQRFENKNDMNLNDNVEFDDPYAGIRRGSISYSGGTPF